MARTRLQIGCATGARRVKILYHHRTRGREVEGVHIRGIVHALRDLGHQVSVLSFPGADPESEPPANAQKGAKRGLAGWLTKTPGVFFELLELAYNLITWFRIRSVFRRDHPDLIYERYSLYLCATVWMARRSGIPLILEINDSALVPRVRPLILKGLARRIEGWCLRNCTGIVFISSYFRDIATKAHGTISPSVISPNAADIGRFDPSRFDRAELRAAKGLDGQIVCGYVGAFVRWHGVAEFMRDIAARLAKTPHLTLILVGGGSDLAAVEATIAEHGLREQVLTPGRVDHREIPDWIACMDFAVLPNSNEYGSPMKLFEFMAMGVAVLAPDYAPIAEVIDDGVSGWLFPKGQTKTCIDRALELSSQPESLTSTGNAARAYIVRERQWRNNAEQLLSLLTRGEDSPADRKETAVS